jgi:hypothetical protein
LEADGAISAVDVDDSTMDRFYTGIPPQLPAASFQLEAGSWKLGAGSWKLGAGSFVFTT